MNLYKISQIVNNDWDTYDSAIVAAENEEEAKKINPCQYAVEEWWVGAREYSSWCFKLEDVKVELIGVAKEGIEKGVVIASFNAG
jgi:hypothetical protein